MAKERTTVRMQAQIKLMSEQGHSIRSIARVLRLSRRTVRKYLESAPPLAMESGGWEEKIDWDYVRQEVYGKRPAGRLALNKSAFGFITNRQKKLRSISATGFGSPIRPREIRD